VSWLRPDRFRAFIGFDNPLAHRIEAGADFFLMPSRFEPCGLNQLYSLRYGTLPIVRATGGLADTVAQYNEARGSGTGFVFNDLTPTALYNVIGWAFRPGTTTAPHREHAAGSDEAEFFLGPFGGGVRADLPYGVRKASRARLCGVS